MSKTIKKQKNKIIIALIILMLWSFVMPIISNATLLSDAQLGFAAEDMDASIIDGGEIKRIMVPILLIIPDLLLNLLQQIFIDENSDIALEDPKGGVSHYFIYYSPGVIFSGKVPGLDVNFFSPMGENGRVTLNRTVYRYEEVGDFPGEEETLKTLENNYGLNLEEMVKQTSFSKTWKYLFWFGKDVTYIMWTDVNTEQMYWYHMYTETHTPVIMYVLGGLLCVTGFVALFWGKGSLSLKLMRWGFGIIIGSAAIDTVVANISKFITERDGTLYKVFPETKTSYRMSIAHTLRSIVATYYRVLFEIALVVLLSVLVYVAIKMIISSASKDKAKYKQMMGHWVTAVCILFLLHFFMNMVLTSIQAVNDVFSSVFIDIEGKDLLMSDIRTKIGHDPNNEDLTTVFSSIVIYIVLVIYTIQFTVVYLKRVIHIAFLIMIAPMVVFTYPIDKMKDGKAQALSLWIKEFSFNSLMQPIHLILYYVFVDGAMDYVMTNPLYALVMIGFLKPGEKFVRKIFGLEEDSSLGKMTTAVLGGAAVMSAIKNIGSKIKSASSKGEKGDKGNNSKIRTKNSDKDSYASLKGKGQSGGGSEKGKGQNEKSRRNIDGIKKVAKKYVLNKKSAKNILKGGVKLASATALGTVGFAAGIATGDMKNAFAGAAGGIAAGNRVGGNLVDGGANLINGVSGGIRGVGDTFGEGAYGKDEYARMKFDKEFKKSEEYKNLMDKYPGKENDIQEFLNAGITDTNQMGIAMKNIQEGKYNAEEAVAYMKMAKASDCPDEVLYDKEMFETYLSSRGIPETEADRIRKGIIDFR